MVLPSSNFFPENWYFILRSPVTIGFWMCPTHSYIFKVSLGYGSRLTSYIKFMRTQKHIHFTLKYAKSFLPMEALKTLYRGIVEPHFRYCCFVWGCCGSVEISHLQKLQNRAARVITNSSFDAPSKPLIHKLGWKTIEELINCETKTMVFKFYF